MKVWKSIYQEALYPGDKLWKYYPKKHFENLKWIVETANGVGYTFKDSVFSKNYVWKASDFVLVDIPNHYLVDDPLNPYYQVVLAEGKPPIWI